MSNKTPAELFAYYRENLPPIPTRKFPPKSRLKCKLEDIQSEYGKYLGTNSPDVIYIPAWHITLGKVIWPPFFYLILSIILIPSYFLIITLILPLYILPLSFINTWQDWKKYRQEKLERELKKFYKGLYIGKDFLIFYLNKNSVHIIHKDEISLVTLVKTMIPSNDAAYEDSGTIDNIVMILDIDNTRYQFAWVSTDSGLSKTAYEEFFDKLIVQWKIPYSELDKVYEIPILKGIERITVSFSPLGYL